MKLSIARRPAVFALILLAALCFCFCACAAGSGDCGEDVHWELNDEGHLRIFGTGPMVDYTYSSKSPWGSEATSVTIESGVTTIGNYAFYFRWNSKPLASVTIAPTVKRIGERAFYDRKELESLTIPADLEFIGTEAFYRCDAKLYAEIGTAGAVTVSKAGRSFFLTESDLELKYDLDGDTVKGLAFLSCSREAVSVSVPEGVTRIGDSAFGDCVKLNHVELPDTLKEIGGFAFSGCAALAGIDLPAGLTSLKHEAFYESGLISVTVPGGVEELDQGIFAGCASLEKATLEEGIKNLPLAMFYHCKALQDLTLPPTVMTIGRLALADCGLKQVTLPSGVTTLENSAFYSDPNLVKVVIPDSVVHFGDYLFEKSDKAVIYCSKGSPADLYAQDNGMKTVFTGLYVPPVSGGDLKAGKTASISGSFDLNAAGTSWENPYAVSSDDTIVEVKGFTTEIDSAAGRINFKAELKGVYPGVAFIRIFVRTAGGDVKVWQKAVFVSGKLPVYKVTVTVSDEKAGTAKADPASGTEGTEVTLKADAKKGYAFKKWRVLKGGVEIRNNRFVLGRNHVSVEAVFEQVSLSGAEIGTVKDQVYTGKAVRPKLSVKLNGTVLKAGRDYTVTYKNNKKVGKASATVTGKGKYTGTKKISFVIVPKAVAISSVKAGKEKVTVLWKRGTGITGYEIQYSLKKSFKGAETVLIRKPKTVSTVIGNLKPGKTYYVRVRTYKTVKGTVYYSAWSDARSARVK